VPVTYVVSEDQLNGWSTPLAYVIFSFSPQFLLLNILEADRLSTS